MLALEEVYDVTMVKDGQEAFDTVKSSMEKGRVFDLIFMDIQVSPDFYPRTLQSLWITKYLRCPIWTAFKALVSFEKWGTRPQLWHLALSRKKVTSKTAWTRGWTCSLGKRLTFLNRRIQINDRGSKPIRRPALKQVLNKFATIPEELEINP